MRPMAAPSRRRPAHVPFAALVGRPKREVVRGTIVTPWRRVTVVVRITRSILRAHRTMSSAAANTAIEIGRQLVEVRAKLERGQWLQWIDEAVPFGRRTVQNYLALVAWAEREPDDFTRFAHLDTSKLYRIAALPPEARATLKTDEPIRIPGGIPKLLDAMSVAELDRVIGGLATPPVPEPALAKIVAGYRHRLAGLGQLNAQLLAQARDVDRKVVSELAAELRGLAQDLEAALG
jgi:hypothetical protein